jgi:hypothetical protein
MTIGYDKPLYVLPFDHRATFSKNMFGWPVDYRAQKITRDTAVARIAASYREWVDLFEKANRTPRAATAVLLEDRQ